MSFTEQQLKDKGYIFNGKEWMPKPKGWEDKPVGAPERKKGRSRVDGQAIVELHNERVGLSFPAKPKEKLNKYILAICDELNKNRIRYVTEFQFNPDRKWRFDIYVTNEVEKDYFDCSKIGIEFNGGQWSNGRHTRGMGYANDLDKINAAQCGGYKVLQFTTSHFDKKTGIGAAGIVKMIKQILET